MTVNDRGVKNEQMERLRKTWLYGKIYLQFITVLRIRGYCTNVEDLNTLPVIFFKKKDWPYTHSLKKVC